jgi:hypothetical protein
VNFHYWAVTLKAAIPCSVMWNEHISVSVRHSPLSLHYLQVCTQIPGSVIWTNLLPVVLLLWNVCVCAH